MSQWLLSEAKWAREKALESENRAAALEDPKKLAAMVKDARREVAMAQSDLQAARARLAGYTDPASWQSLIEGNRREATYWRQLAEGHEARMAQADETSMFGDEEVGT